MRHAFVVKNHLPGAQYRIDRLAFIYASDRLAGRDKIFETWFEIMNRRDLVAAGKVADTARFGRGVIKRKPRGNCFF